MDFFVLSIHYCPPSSPKSRLYICPKKIWDWSFLGRKHTMYLSSSVAQGRTWYLTGPLVPQRLKIISAVQTEETNLCFLGQCPILLDAWHDLMTHIWCFLSDTGRLVCRILIEDQVCCNSRIFCIHWTSRLCTILTNIMCAQDGLFSSELFSWPLSFHPLQNFFFFVF